MVFLPGCTCSTSDSAGHQGGAWCVLVNQGSLARISNCKVGFLFAAAQFCILSKFGAAASFCHLITNDTNLSDLQR